MNKLWPISLLLCLITFFNWAQSPPEAISYQGVARDDNGEVLVNRNLTLRISILLGNENGMVEYSETHEVTTNDFGLFTLQIGRGEVLSGSFSDINWGSGSHYAKVEIRIGEGMMMMMEILL